MFPSPPFFVQDVPFTNTFRGFLSLLIIPLLIVPVLPIALFGMPPDISPPMPRPEAVVTLRLDVIAEPV